MKNRVRIQERFLADALPCGCWHCWLIWAGSLRLRAAPQARAKQWADQIMRHKDTPLHR